MDFHRKTTEFPASISTPTRAIFEETWPCAGAASGTGPATAGDLDLEGFRASRPATEGRFGCFGWLGVWGHMIHDSF